MKSDIYAGILPFVAVLALAFSSGGHTAGGNYSSNADLGPIIKLIDAGDYNTAIDRLHNALDEDPDNADIMYLETDQFDKAMQQLEILDSLCTFNCKEYSTLKKAIDTYQQAASNS